uniref:Uncharacterized protein n=1 Tax=Glossina pallidipes TaxID=7398 RepID=A0A1B0A9L7_GLOPL
MPMRFRRECCLLLVSSLKIEEENLKRKLKGSGKTVHTTHPVDVKPFCFTHILISNANVNNSENNFMAQLRTLLRSASAWKNNHINTTTIYVHLNLGITCNRCTCMRQQLSQQLSQQQQEHREQQQLAQQQQHHQRQHQHINRFILKSKLREINTFIIKFFLLLLQPLFTALMSHLLFSLAPNIVAIELCCAMCEHLISSHLIVRYTLAFAMPSALVTGFKRKD